MLDHSLSLLVTTDALDLARAHSTDHVSDTLGNSCLQHLVQLAHIHAQIVNVVTVLVHIKYN